MKGKHILVVEDEEPIRRMTRFSLERAGVEVSEAELLGLWRDAVRDGAEPAPKAW